MFLFLAHVVCVVCCTKDSQTLPTELVVLQHQPGIISFTHNGRHRDLPHCEGAVLFLILVFLLDVERRISAGRGDQLVPGQHANSHMIGRYGSGCCHCTSGLRITDRKKKGRPKRKVLTINLLVPFKLSKKSFRAALSFWLASLLDFFPFPFPLFPFFPLLFFLELCFSCASSSTFSFISAVLCLLCVVFVSSAAESCLQKNRNK